MIRLHVACGVGGVSLDVRLLRSSGTGSGTSLLRVAVLGASIITAMATPMVAAVTAGANTPGNRFVPPAIFPV